MPSAIDPALRRPTWFRHSTPINRLQQSRNAAHTSPIGAEAAELQNCFSICNQLKKKAHEMPRKWRLVGFGFYKPFSAQTIGNGNARKRLPLSDAIALATAGAKGGKPTSPMPPGWLSVGMTFKNTSGASLARSTW